MRELVEQIVEVVVLLMLFGVILWSYNGVLETELRTYAVTAEGSGI